MGEVRLNDRVVWPKAAREADQAAREAAAAEAGPYIPPVKAEPWMPNYGDNKRDRAPTGFDPTPCEPGGPGPGNPDPGGPGGGGDGGGA